MHRLFVALRPMRPTRDVLLGLTDGVPGARWQDDDQLHLTLRFIGEVDRPKAEDIALALSRIDRPRPIITCEGVGAFGPDGRPHTLWAGVRQDPALIVLRHRIERALVVVGLPPERRAFLPHVTLARLNRSAGPVAPFLARHAGFSAEPMELRDFRLYESLLGGSGASYSPIACYPLT